MSSPLQIVDGTIIFAGGMIIALGEAKRALPSATAIYAR
jgi:hypothetical protein